MVLSATTLNIFFLQTSSAEGDQHTDLNISLSLLRCMLTLRRWADRPCGKGQTGVYQAIDIHDIPYTGKYSLPFRFFALVVRWLFLDWANSNVSNYLPLNTTVSGRIQDGAKLFASVEGRKLHGGKNNPVCSIYIPSILTSKEFKVPK